jgi:aerobic carbon-monoxide dehydrogenase large subunit
MIDNDFQGLKQPSQPALLRREDERLLQGLGAFVGNVTATNSASKSTSLHAVFLRSPYAKAAVLSIDSEYAASLPDVVAIFTAKDSAHLHQPQVNTGLIPITVVQHGVMNDAVAYVGAPVALVIARSRDAAQAAADGLMVNYEPQDAALDFESVNEPLATCSNLQGTVPGYLATATVSVNMPRIAASPLEPRAAHITWDEVTQTLTAHLSTQTPARAQTELAAALNLTLAQVRVIAVDVGGAFGGKASIFPEDIMLASAAKQLNASLLWQATRGEDLLSSTHGRGSQLSAQLWVDESGMLQALQADVQFTLGAWLPYSAVVPLRNTVRILPGPYRVPNVAVNGAASASNAAAVGIYRGAGRPEAAILMERAFDAAAATLGIDPLAMRLANVWQPHELPRQLSEPTYQDTANFPALLNRCAELFDYPAKRKAQRPLSANLQGIGIALYTEPCGAGGESVRLTANADGTYLLATGSTAQGQGRETSYAAIAAQALGCKAENVQVTHGDTAHNPAGVGALASRSTAIGGSAILEAVEKLCTELATGKPLPHKVEVFHTVANEAWASGCVMVALTVNKDTGRPTIDELVWVDDAGRVMNDTFQWHCAHCGGLVARFELQLQSIVSDLPKVFAQFYDGEAATRVCGDCGEQHPGRAWQDWHSVLDAKHSHAAIPKVSHAA